VGTREALHVAPLDATEHARRLLESPLRVSACAVGSVADLVGRNVATLVDAPKGQAGRPSRSLTLDQPLALLQAAQEPPLNAYVVLSLTVGIRTEEARELHWDYVDLDGDPSAARPVPPSSGRMAFGAARWRHQDGQVATDAGAAQAAVQALKEHRKRQVKDRLAAGAPVAGSRPRLRLGTRDASRRGERPARVPQDPEAAGLGTGLAPRDLRHTFVSLMSADGVRIEEIARLAGHNRTATTELVYRHELRPVITAGAEVMDRILNIGDHQ
jgi:integrase